MLKISLFLYVQGAFQLTKDLPYQRQGVNVALSSEMEI